MFGHLATWPLGHLTDCKICDRIVENKPGGKEAYEYDADRANDY